MKAEHAAVGADPGTSADKPTTTKTLLVTRLLAQARGATVPELMEATGWQRRTVRARLTRIRKIGKVMERVERKSGPAGYRLFWATIAVETITSGDAEPATIDG